MLVCVWLLKIKFCSRSKLYILDECKLLSGCNDPTKKSFWLVVSVATAISTKMFGWLISRYIYYFSKDDVRAIVLCTAYVGPGSRARPNRWMQHAAASRAMLAQCMLPTKLDSPRDSTDVGA